MRVSAAEAARAARAIEGWLLDSGVQLADGPERGGVAGWLDRDRQPEFVYAEITGYYLVFAAWLAAGGAGSRQRATDGLRRGRDAAAWLHRAMQRGPLPTRLYLDRRGRDWRNAATFSFDLAMAARGAGCFAVTAGDDGAAVVARDLADRLRELAGDVAPLRSHVVLEARGHAELPRRWSTLPGPHHVKAAAAVLRLPPGTVDSTLCDVAARTVAHWSAAVRSSWRWADLHPLLYCLEGELLLGAYEAAGPRAELAGAYKRLMAHQRVDGSLPGSLEADERAVRADVVAQALRIGALLRAHGALEDEGWPQRLEGLAATLLTHVGRDGSVAFHRGDARGNAWAAMFAHQALLDYAADADGRAPAQEALALLV
jgi:hypothetical protein